MHSETPVGRDVTPRLGLVIRWRAYREALAIAFRAIDDFAVADVGDGPVEAIVERLLALAPDVVLVDVAATDGPVLIREIHRAMPAVRIIALNQEDDAPATVSLFELGLTGCLSRDCSIDDVRSAIRNALADEFQCDPRVTAAMIRRLNEVGDRDGRVGATRISPREAHVLSFLESGLTNKQIAHELGLEEATIKNHVHNILRKLGVHHRREAVRRYRRDPAL